MWFVESISPCTVLLKLLTLLLLYESSVILGYRINGVVKAHLVYYIFIGLLTTQYT